MTTQIDTAEHQMKHLANTPTKYRAAAFREASELEAALTADAKTAAERALARAAGTTLLAIRTWHWRRIARRKFAATESADLVAHTNALVRLLEKLGHGQVSGDASHTPAAATAAQPSAQIAREPYTGPSAFGWVQDGVVVGTKPAADGPQ